MPTVTTTHFAISSREASTGVLQVSLSGDFDMSVGSALADALVEAARTPGVSSVIVDLQHTVFIDSHTVAALIAGYAAAASAGRSFTLVNGRGVVQQVLDITGLSEVLCEQS